MFNPQTFMQNAAGPMATSIPQPDEGEYRAFVDSDPEKAIELKEVNTKNGPRHIMTLWWVIDDPAVREKLKREKVRVKQDIWLDLTSDGALASGETDNTDLGRVRAALGQNTADWNPTMLFGAGPVMARVSQRSDQDDPKIKYSEIKRVTKIG